MVKRSVHAGHGEAVQHVKSFGRPMLVAGGGGYTKANVARCWTNETATLLNQELDPKLPSTIYDEYFVSDPTLRLDAREGAADEHANKPADLDALLQKVMRNLEALRTAPAVNMKVSFSLPESDVEELAVLPLTFMPLVRTAVGTYTAPVMYFAKTFIRFCLFI